MATQIIVEDRNRAEAKPVSPGQQAPGLSRDAPSVGPEELPLLLRYWRIALRWRWLILAILGASLLLGVIVTFLMTPRYTAVARLEIARQQDRVVQVQDVTPDTTAADQEFYATQYALLVARSLAERVATNLKLADDPQFFRTMRVRLPGESLFGSDNARVSPAVRADRQRVAADVLLRYVRIDPIRGSRLVEVSYISPDPQLSARVANAWTTNFIEQNLNRRFDATAYARRFLEERLEQLRQRLEQSERALVAYAGQERIISIPTTGSSGERSDRPIVADDLAALNAELQRATADRVRAESRVGGAGGASPEALSNSAISALRQRRAELLSEYSKLLVQFEPGYPQAVALRRQIGELDRQIGREEGRVSQSANNTYTEAQRREQALQGRVDALKNNLLDLRRRSIQYNIYQREVDTNRSLYEGLLQRYKEIGVAGGVGTNNISIVDPAEVPRAPSSPKLLLNLFLALLAGSILASAAVFGLEQIDEAIKDPNEAERATRLPTLGVIPLAESTDLIEALADRKSAQSEAYLSMQTALAFSSDHGVPRSLAVTSTRASEGKSTTAYAIALSLTRTKRRVILIDADMRSPSVHHLLGITNGRGVSSFLAGDDRLDSMIHELPELELSALTAGASPPSAAELLTGPRLALLLRTLLEHYDHVVVDCPPVLGLADAPLVASQVEGVVYAVRARGARSRLIRQAIARLRAANANLLGTVLTMFEVKRAHYGYGYDYGYGYGSDTKTAA